MLHRIRRQILDLELPREAGAVALQRQVGRVFQEKVLPRLDELFSKIAPADRIVRIDRLEIDLGAIGETGWEHDFIERCVEHIGRQVAEAAFTADPAAGQGIETLDPAANVLVIWAFFLETGALPWYARGMGLRELEARVIEASAGRPAVVRHTLAPLLRQPGVLARRLVWQFSPAFVETILESALGLPDGWMTQAIHMLRSLSGQVLDTDRRIALAEALLALGPTQAPRQAPHPGILAALLEGHAATPEHTLVPPPKVPAPAAEMPEAALPDRDADLPTAAPGPAKAEAPAQAPQQPVKKNLPLDGLPTDNAGLVLLGPYFSAFFQELQLTDGVMFHDDDRRFRALHLLHFLATGLEHPEEPALLLPKLLCGLELEAPAPLELHLTEREKAECTDLLDAAVRNWPVLKNTSADGLRHGFLQRPGLLYRTDGPFPWMLRMERLGQDVLLERLPWSISVIKLPWMAEAVRVEW